MDSPAGLGSGFRLAGCAAPTGRWWSPPTDASALPGRSAHRGRCSGRRLTPSIW
ncbi:MAG: hypothetical protein ACLRWQ_01700 [Flavonifractor plautii]